MPERIQLSRRKGWRLPPGAVSVARPTRWGNPFEVSQFGQQLAVDLYSDVVHGLWDPAKLGHLSDGEYFEVYDRRESWMRRIHGHPTEVARSLLRGLNLACWCPLPAPGQPDICHATVLLELANNGRG